MSPTLTNNASKQPTIDDIWTWLDTVSDPEIPVISVVDLGVVRQIHWEGDSLQVVITPTYSGCPAMSVMASDIKAELGKHGLHDVTIKTQIAPAWTTQWLSDKGREQLETYGIAPPTNTGGPKQCPRCNSNKLEIVSQFGSTPCKALWRCNECLEPFDYFKCL